MKKKMPKFLKVILIIIAIPIGIVLLLLGYIQYISYIDNRKVTKVDTQTSPDGFYTVKLYAVGRPKQWFAEHASGRVILYEDDTEISSQYINVPNTLEPTAAENWSVEWQEDMVRFNVYYFDHGNKIMVDQYEMYYNGTIQNIPKSEWQQ